MIQAPYFQAQTWGQQNSHGGNLTVVDKVLPDMVSMISPYWYQFPPMNPLWYGVIGFVIAILGTISFLGNALVMYVFGGTRSLRTPSNLLVMNLAFSDFCMMIGMCPIMIINCYYETWIFGPFLCEFYGMWGSLFGCNSILSMMAIALDRYNVIVKGISGTPFTNKKAMFWVVLIWLFSLLWTIFPFVGWGKYGPEGNMTACGTDYLNREWLHRSYILAYAGFCYFMPLFVIIYSYFFIIRAVSAHEKSMREQAKKMNVTSLRTTDNAKTSAEFKLAKVALTTISLWFIAWTPYLIVNFMGIFEASPISPLNTIWCSLFAKANSVYNPIVYAISHPKYKAALGQKFPSLACASTPEAKVTDDNVSEVTTTNA